jgi:hypothetical protein
MRMIHPLVAAFGVLALTGCCKMPSSSSDSSGPISITPPATTTTDHTYTMDFPCDNEPGLRIRQIVLSATETRILARFQNKGARISEISTAPSGHAETFFIESGDQSRSLELRSSVGIAVSPSKTKVPPNGFIDFTLIFPPIDPSWGPIDLHEGKVYKKGTTYWNFTDIPLR